MENNTKQEESGCLNFENLHLDIQKVLEKYGVSKAMMFVECPECEETSNLNFMNPEYYSKKEINEFQGAANYLGSQIFLTDDYLWWLGDKIEDANELMDAEIEQESLAKQAGEILGTNGVVKESPEIPLKPIPEANDDMAKGIKHFTKRNSRVCVLIGENEKGDYEFVAQDGIKEDKVKAIFGDFYLKVTKGQATK